MQKLIKSLLIIIVAGILVSAVSGYAIATGSITGTVQYDDGWTSGAIYIGVFNDPDLTQNVGGTMLPSGPGPFTIGALNPGDYYVGAYLDLGDNNPSAPGPEDPAGYSPNNPIAVTEGGTAEAGTISLIIFNQPPVFEDAAFFGSTGDEKGNAIAIADGKIFVSGISVEGQSSAATSFVASYDLQAPGSPAWSKTFAFGTNFFGITATDEGVYTGGYNWDLTTDSGAKEVKGVLVKFLPDGSSGGSTGDSVWVATPNFFTYEGVEGFYAAANAEEGGLDYIYTAGFGQPCSYGAYLVAKYDTSGNLIASATDSTVGIAFDQCYTPTGNGGSTAMGVSVLNGGVYVTGNSAWVVEGDNEPKATLWKYDSSLNLQWRQKTSVAGAFNAVTASGNAIYVAGYNSVGSNGGTDVYIAKYDESGTLLWSQEWGGTADDIAHGVAVSDDRLYVVGETGSFGAGAKDAFLLEVDTADGMVLSNSYWGGTADDIAKGVVISGQEIYAVGQTASEGAGGIDMMLLRYATGAEGQQYTASGTYTNAAGTLTLNTTSSDFACEGPDVGAPEAYTVVSITETDAILEESDGYQMTWTRASGTAGDIVGTWQMIEGPNTWELTFNGDLSFVITATIVECGDEPAGVIYGRYPDGYQLEMFASGDLTGVTGVNVEGPVGSGVSAFPLPNQEVDEFWGVYPSDSTFIPSMTPGDYTFTFTGGSIDPIVYNFQPGTPMELPTGINVTGMVVSWNPVSGATKYYLQIYNDLSDLIYDGEMDPPVTSPVDISSQMAFAPDGDYQVRVVAEDMVENSAFSAPFPFTKAAAGSVGSITGTVDLAEWVSGPISVGAFANPYPTPQDTPITGTILNSGPGAFEITDVPAGTYYVYAIHDTGSQVFNGESPNNMPDGIIVIADTASDAGTIVLTEVAGQPGETFMPIAIAGLDFTTIVGTEVTLDGTKSKEASTYAWTQTAGTPVTLNNADTAQPTFTPSSTGAYTFQLVVNNGSEDSLPDNITVTAVAAGTEEAAIVNTFENLNSAFDAYLSNPTPTNMDTIMSYFSASFLDDGMDYLAMRADLEEMLGEAIYFEMNVTNIQVDGTSATSVLTSIVKMYNEWGQPVTEFDNWTLNLLKEGADWKAYGNQQMYDVWVETISKSDGTAKLSVGVEAEDEVINSVTISGPGITGDVALYDDGLHYDNQANDEQWGRLISLSSAPVVGDTYTFTINGSEIVTSQVTGIMTGVATNGTVSETMPPTFYWDPADGAIFYTVKLFNASDGSQVWGEWGIHSPFVSYMGPPLFVGTTYQWKVLSFDMNENASESELFSFVPTFGLEGGDKSVSGIVFGPGPDFTPLANIWVNAWSESADFGFGAQTNQDGEFTISNLVAASDYRIDIWNENYANQFFKKDDSCTLPPASDGVVDYSYCQLPPVGTSDWSQATLVDLFVNSASGVDFVMKPGVSISGKVTTDGVTGVGQVWINAWSDSTGAGGGTETMPDGTFVINGLVEASDYRVEVWDDIYAHQFYKYEGDNPGADPPTNNDYSGLTPVGTSQWEEVTLVNTTGDYPAQGIHFIVSEGSSISGLVLANGSPVSNVWVNAWSEGQMTGNGSQTNQNGEYTINGLIPASDYKVDIWSPDYTYQVYNNKTDWMQADLVDITSDVAVNINFNLGSGNSISGQVTDDTGEGVAGVWVNAHSESTGFGRGEPTDAGGNYTIPGLVAASDYRVDIWADGYVGQFYDGKSDWNQADLVDVTGGNVTDIDFTLSAGVYIEGTITIPEGENNFSNLWVNAWSDTTGFGNGTSIQPENVTGNTATYRIPGLAAASDYKVDVWSDQYGHKFYNESASVSDWAQATPVSTMSGSVSNIDITLSGGNSISGTISGLVSGDRVWVNAWSDTASSGSGTEIIGTGSDVAYTIRGLDPAGDYRVEFNADKYQNQFYNGVTDWMLATLVDVSSGDATGIDFTLSTGVSISGTILDSEGNGISNIWVDAWSENGSWGGAMTDADGNFTITGLTDGVIYNVNIWHPDYANQSQQVTTGTVDADSVDFSLGAGISISGTVTAGGNPVPNAWVNAWSDSSMSGRGEQTDANGNYILRGLAASNDYRVDVWADGYANQFYNNKTMWDEADLVDASGGSVTGIDFTLSAGNTISGSITIPEGGSTTDIWVNAWSDTKGGMGAPVNNWTDNTGTYEITGLVPGSDYKVDVWSPNYQHVFYNAGIPEGVSDWMQATQVDISSGDAGNIDISLGAGKKISGTVTAPGSLNNLWISAWSESAGSWGNGQVNVSDGTYEIIGLASAADFKVDIWSENYGYQVYNGKKNWDNADLVSTEGGDVTGIDFNLTTGTSVSGRITDSFGDGIADAWVNIWSETNRFGRGAPTDADGYYVIGGVEAADDYKLDVWSPEYGNAYYKDDGGNNRTGDWMQATPIDTTSGNVTGIDMILAQGGSISGHVEDGSGNPISGVWVNAWCDQGGNGAETDVNGDYLIKGLPAASNYKVDVWAEGYVHVYYDNQNDWNLATEVDITSENATGIDFILGSGNTISGTVMAGVTPIAHIWVNAWSETTGSSGGAETDSNGQYTISGLSPANDYVLDVWSETYAHQFYNQKTDWMDADRVDLSSGDQTGIDFNLSSGNKISGQITLPGGDTDYYKVWVNAWSDVVGAGNGSPVKYDGTFKIAGLVPGAGYKLDVWSEDYIHVYYKNDGGNNSTADWVDADELDISSGDVSGINLTLSSGGSISGTVYQPDGTTPAANVWVDAHSSTAGSWGGTETAADGTYTITGLAMGSDYTVSTWTWDYVNVSQTGVSTGDNTVDLTLSTGVSISGTLRNDSGGISGAWVDAWSDALGVGGWAQTDANGDFTITGLSPNTTYNVSAAVGGEGFVSDDVAVLDQDIPGVDLHIVAGDSISGTVTKLSDGTPITDVEVIVVAFATTDGSFYNSTTASATDGAYTIPHLPAGTYRILVKAEGYADMWYGGPAYETAADVNPGTANIDFAITP